MKIQQSKKFPSIACCGIDCGLCPTYYTEGPSKCPGCGGLNFSSKHPSCLIFTCCVKKNGFETCADCTIYPCEKLINWDKVDSFVTHKVCLQNLNEIKKNGIELFIEQQTMRIRVLESLLCSFNEGRSKSFFCISAALLPIDDLIKIFQEAKIKVQEENLSLKDIKSKSRIIKKIINEYAKKESIELKLRKGAK
jgi:hypothetical protein